MTRAMSHLAADREERRLEDLGEYEILGTPSEESYERIARLASHLCRTPVALVNLLDRTRQWTKASVGTGHLDVARELSLCSRAVEEDAIVVVEDARRDPRFQDNPLVARSPGIRFYAGVPVHGRQGLPLGTLSVIDYVPRRLEPDQRDALVLLAREVEVNLELRRAHLERVAAERAKNTFVAMIGHDLRGPLTVLETGLSLLQSRASCLTEEDRKLLDELIASTDCVERMLDDAHDATRGQAPRPRYESVDVASFCRTLAAGEQRRAGLFGRRIRFDVEVEEREFRTDPSWVRRIVGNFVDNAVKYAPPGSGIVATADFLAGNRLRIAVADEGPGIPPHLRERVFEPFFRLRADASGARSGTGLGLAFCRMAARAMGGEVGVSEASEAGGARFWLELPSGPKPSASEV